MSVGAIIGIVIGCLVVVGGIIAGCVIFFKKKKSQSGSNNEQPESNNQDNGNGGEEQKPEIVQLRSVARQTSNNELGLETDQEVQNRLSSLSKEEFLSKDTNEYPWSEEDYSQLDQQAIDERKSYETKILFAYRSDKTLNEDTAPRLRREF